METERAERARAAIMRALAAYRSGLGRLAGVGTGGRLIPTFEWSNDESSAVSEIVSIGEVFTDDRFQDAFGAPIAARTWPARQQKWQQGNVSLVACPVWAATDGYIQARNAILHNRGRLTGIQTQSPQTRQDTISALAAANIRVTDRDRLIVGPAHVEAAAVAVGHYVAWLDAAAP